MLLQTEKLRKCNKNKMRHPANDSAIKHKPFGVKIVFQSKTHRKHVKKDIK